MRNFLLLIILVLMSSISYSQTYVFQEDFEGATLGVTSTSVKNNNNWAITTKFAASGLKADSATVGLGDTTYLTTNTFSTVGSSVVYLEFDHIAKIEYGDYAVIEVSTNNGATWTRVTNGYMGNGQFNNIGNRFTAASYTLVWDPGIQTTIPTASWWQHEKFNISAYAGNSSQVKVRFALMDDNNTGAIGNYGWLIDNIQLWVPSLQEVSAVSFLLPYALPSGCGLGGETIQLRISNNGAAIINGNLTASFQREGQAVVTENVPNIIVPFDTATFTFTNTIDLSSTVDTNYKVKVWVTLLNDPNQTNDTILDTLISKVALADPVFVSPTIPFGTSTTLTATHTDSITWSTDPLGANIVQYGSSYTTPILLDTTTFYVQAGASQGGAFIISEVCHYKYTVGAPSGGWPTYLTSDDYIEITGVPNSDLGGFVLEQWNTTAIANTYTFPAGTVLSPSGTAIIVVGQVSGSPSPSNYYYHGNTAVTWSSSTAAGRILKDPSGNIVDAVGVNGFSFPASANVPASEWSNSPVNGGSTSGFRLIGTDNNSGSNWAVTSSTVLQDPNSLNAGVILPSSSGCPSRVVPVKVSVSGIPVYNAGITHIVTPTGSQTQGSFSPVVVNLKNYAGDTLTKVNISYSVNGVLKNTVAWTGSLPYNQTTQVTLGTDTFFGGAYTFRAWTWLPNDSVDQFTSNDTAMAIAYVCLSGTFTLGDANSDFPNFASLMTILDNVGVCGPTTIRIKPGTYDGQLTFQNINGLSDSSNLVFESFSGLNTDVIIQYSASSTTDNWTILLDGADFLTFKNLTIKANGTTYGRVVELRNGADYNRFENNRLIATTPASSSSSACIYDYSTINNYNTYLNNYMEGGYYTMYIYGGSSALWEKGTVIQGNEIVGSYYYPMYVYYQDSIQIIGNYIHSGAAPYSYGISCYYIFNGYKIVGNKINLVATSGTCYGLRESYGNYSLYNATPTSYGLVANNMISISGYSAGSHYGLYSYYCEGSDVYNNTAVINDGSANSYSLYQYNYTSHLLGQNFKNNLFVNFGSGLAANFGTPGLVTSLDYNNYYSLGADLANWNGLLSSLSAFQSASGKDANSLNILPTFFGVNDLRLLTTSLSGKGVTLAAVTTDIFGTPRGNPPTIGAHEVPLLGKDAGVMAILNPTVTSTISEADTVAFKVTIKNYGFDTLTSVQVNYKVNGTQYIGGVYNGQILPNATDTFTIGNYISPAGNVTICAYTALANDTNYFNDSTCYSYYSKPLYDAKMNRIIPIAEGCGLSTDSVKVVIKNIGSLAINSSYVLSYQFVGSSTAVNETVSLPIAVNDSIIYTFNTLADFTTTVDSTFELTSWVTLTADGVNTNDTAYTEVKSLVIPNSPIVNDTTIPYGTFATIHASSPDSIIWFATDTSTIKLFEGAYYTTPILYDTTTYWVEAKGGGNSGTAIIGTGSVQNTNTTYPAPYGNWYWGSKEQYLILASELTAQGYSAGLINSLAFDVVTANGTALQGFEIKMGHSQLTDLTTNFISNLSTVYSVSSYTESAGWNNHQFQTPFIWNGVDNIVVEVCFNNSSYTNNAVVNQSTTSFVSTTHYNQDAAGVCSITTGSIYSQRPNMKLDILVQTCSSTRVPLTVMISGIPPYDLNLTEILITDGCGVSLEPVTIKVENQGIDSILGGATASFKINNNPWVTTETIPDTIPQGGYIYYTFNTLANISSTADSMFTITAWVNGTLDPNHINDTLVRDSVLSLYTPAPPTATSPVNIAYGVTTNLTASGTDTLMWYNDLQDTIPFIGGSPITVGPLYVTDSFYVASQAGIGGVATLGTGTTVNTTTTYPSPYGNWYYGSKEQYMIQASELTALGFGAGKISSLAFDVVTVNGVGLSGFEIKMGHTTANAMTTAFVSNLSTVYSTTSYTETSGWNTHVFQTPFVWNGTDNLIIEVCFNNSSYTNNAVVNQTTTSFVSTTHYNADAAGVCATATGSTFSQRPNMKLGLMATGCSSSKVPVIVQVAPPPALDAAMQAIVNPVGSTQSGIPTPVQVQIRHYGSDTLVSTTITYKLNNVVKTNYSWTGSLPFNTISAPVTVYTDTFPGGVHDLEFYVTGANGTTQAVNYNDTIRSTFAACMNGVYTIGDSTRDFQSFTAALDMLELAGICGHVTFLVDSGMYNEQLAITPILGMDANNTVTFQSATGDSTDVVLSYSATSLTDSYVIFLDGADYFTFKNMTIQASGGTYGYAVLIRNGATFNNFIGNIVRVPAGTSSYFVPFYSNSGLDNFNSIIGNKIQNGYYGLYLYGSSTSSREIGTVISNNTIENFYYYGIYSYYVDSLIIRNNIIKIGSNTNTYHNGITSYYGGGAFDYSGNYINLSPTYYSYGLIISQHTSTAIKKGLVSNNMIIINGGSGSSYGIQSSTNTHVNFYNNSVNIVGGISSSRAGYFDAGSDLKVVNNMFNVNGIGYPFYTSSTTSITTNDYNAYNTQGAYIAYWGANRATIAALQTANSKDAHSIVADPQFFSFDDLHTSSVDLNGAGYPLSEVPVDIDGQPRSTTTPDIGADEFTPPQFDAGITAINSPVSPITVGSNPTLVTLRNFGLDTLTAVSIGWSVNGVSQTSYSFSDTLATGDTIMNLNIGSFSAVAGANTIKAWTSMPNGQNDQLNINDTSVVTLIGCSGPLAGIYTLGGTTADYPDFASAISALGYCGISDTVVFLVNPGLYNEQIKIDPITGASDTSIVRFTSVNSDSTSVILSFAPTSTQNYVVNLNGADYVHFDHMTIEGTGSVGNAILVGNGAHYNSFTSCIIKMTYSTTSTVNTIYSSGSNDNYNLFANNDISGGYYAIQWRGVSSSSYDKGSRFLNNYIHDFYYYGIYAYGQDSLIFDGNIVNEGSSTIGYYPSYFYYCNNYYEISNNIFDLSPNSYSYGLRVYYCTANSSTPGRVFNNSVSITTGTGASYGITSYYSNYVDMMFNSVNITAGSTTARGAYVYYGSNVRFINNNIVSSVGNTYHVTPSPITAANHNNIYGTPTTINANWNGTTYATLPLLQAATSLDSNSVSVDPGYYSTTDLHATSPIISNSGTPFGGVTHDIDGDLRSLTNPSIGMDEYSSMQYDAAAYGVLQPTATYAAATTSQTVQATYRNFGNDTITSMTLGYKYANNNAVTQAWTGQLLPGGTVNFTFTTPFVVQTGVKQLCVFNSFAADQDNSNDTFCINFAGLPIYTLTYTDNFDGSTTSWTQEGNVWQWGAPAQTTLNAAYSAPKAWMTKLSANYTDNSTAYLYSPFFNIAGVNNAVLKFRHKYKVVSGDAAQVQYSIDGGQNWVLLGFWGDPLGSNWYTGQTNGVHYFSGTQTSWTLSTYNLVDVLASTNNPLQFRFVLTTNASGNDEGWLIDDFSIELPVAAINGGVVSIPTPATSSVIGLPVTVSATVKNFGSDTLFSIPMQYTVNAGVPVAGVFTPTNGLAPGDTATYTFGTTFNSPTSAYNLCVRTLLTGDAYPSNDQLCKNVQVTAAPLDAGVKRIVSPIGTAPLFTPNTVTVMIVNHGTTPLTSVDVQYRLNSLTPVIETWSGTALQMGDSVSYTFSTTYNSPIGSSYQLCAKTLLVGDMDLSNDESCESIIPDGLVEELENGMKLWQNMPNPARDITTIQFEIPTAGMVKFELVDLLGNKLTSSQVKKNAGVHTFELDASKLANGVYFYSIEFDNYRLTKQMVVNR